MARASLTSTRSVIAARSRAGVTRVRVSLPKIVLATVGSVFSYWFAEVVLRHPGPLFAATSALISLNFASTSYVRRTLEVAVGCTLGIAVGDVLLTLFGTGLWQAALVVFVSLALSRFLDSGVVFSMQFGLQSLLVVLLPAPAGGPFTRSLDAIVGGVVALLLVILWPKDPRRQPSRELAALLQQTGGVLRDLSAALVADDSASAWHCLVQARNTQPLVDAAASELAAASEMTRLSPAARRHRGDIDRLALMEVQVDLAVRNVRSLSRRIASLMSHHVLSVAEREDLAETLDGLADAVATLAASVTTTSSSGHDHLTAQARDRLTEVAGSLDPAKLGGGDPQVAGVVMMLRPLCVDLLEAAGVRHDDAVEYLPRF
ncbi:FUSC family protein [Galactobacter caseinivorans]|uniref:FUSC family protein n=1 Tax=Galactobacter caseinivorans TaxID=2676123 RepID=A0A496PGK9_9MICC|nr:FUSC family protein [Galactobacter caseinivorans]RKW69616.1 FUSC family protein [Galactobacter caseinivorans]